MVSAWVAVKRDTAYRLLFWGTSKRTLHTISSKTVTIARSRSMTAFFRHTDTWMAISSEFRILNSTMKLVLPVKYEIMSGRAFHAMEARGYDQAWTYFQAADDVAMKAGIAHDSLYCASRKEALPLPPDG